MKLLSGRALAFTIVLAAIGGTLALVYGVLIGFQDDVDADIDAGIERVLSREVPKGVIDEETGSYRGVALGAPESVVIRELGTPARAGRNEYAVPDVLEGSVYAGASWNCEGEFGKVIAYRDVAFTIVDGRVCSTYVGGGGWSTSGGIRAGDSIEAVKGRFGEDACAKVTRDDPFYAQWECDARLPSGIRIHFGTDPVTGVEIASPRSG